jgi:hypothetical protein
MEKRRTPDVEAAVLNPAAHFSAPDDVLTASGLRDADRRRILESWVEDAKRLSEAEAENMPGGQRSRLREASLALLELLSKRSQRKGTRTAAQP